MLRVFSVMAMAVLAMTAYSHIFEEVDFPLGGDGRTHAKLSLDLAVPAPGIVTRGVDMSQNAQVKIESLWIGVFDTKTGEQVGCMAGHILLVGADQKVSIRPLFFLFSFEIIFLQPVGVDRVLE